MDILIPDDWLRDFLKTKATPNKIAECLSLSGPSVEKVENSVYSIEITTNRVDSASVMGIAKEAAAILPQFGIPASFSPIGVPKLNFKKEVDYLKVSLDSSLCPRFSAVLIRGVKIGPSPEWMIARLKAVGERPINNIVDISNYIMHEIGQPVHTFDYDKIKGKRMNLRQSLKGERLSTLDGKTHILPGGDIVIEDGQKRLIDLAGIMGGAESCVDSSTKNVLLFVQTYKAENIRRTSMALAQRSQASVLFEKGLDPELVTLGLARGIELFEKLSGGKPEKTILDVYKNPYIPSKITTSLEFICLRLGLALEKGKVDKILTSLGFDASWNKNNLTLSVPSGRGDMSIPEDIIEEVARIYGYHNLPSRLMQGGLPEPLPNSPFYFETKVKNILKGLAGTEVYTLSLVPLEFTQGETLRIRNPLGSDSEYLRVSLMPSLVEASGENKSEKEPFHIFEMSNVYLPKKGDLPDERLTLAGIFSNYDYRSAKGILQAFLEEINLPAKYLPEDTLNFVPSKRLVISVKNIKLGQFGELRGGNYYWEFDMELLRKYCVARVFKPSPKFPPQIEDITLTLPEKTKVGDIISSVVKSHKLVANIELKDIYSNSYTFRIWYQDPSKTLSNAQVDEVRKQILSELSKKFGAQPKS